MPIFTSRFSPERSLVGAFLSPQSKVANDAESKNEKRQTDSASSSRSSQAKDRLEITGRQQAETAQVRTSEQTVEVRARETGQKNTQQLSLRRAVREASVAITRTNLSPSAEEPTPSVNATDDVSNAPQNQDASESALPTRLEALVDRLGGLRIERALQAIQNENAQAAQTAGPEPLEALLDQVEQSEQPAVAPPVAIELEQEAQAIDRPERINQLVEQLQKQAPTAPERDVQEADLRRNLKTIATGLQADAAIESRRNIEQTAQNAEVSTQRQQQDTVRDNQTEIRSLQGSRRSLQQEVQKADQAIRQLQSETSRMQNNTPSAAGSGLDILAQ